MVNYYLIGCLSLFLVSCSSQSSNRSGNPTSTAQLTTNRVEVDESDVTIYRAQSIITMDQSNSQVQAVAVAEDRILALGTQRELQQRFANAKLDSQFSEKVIIPGLIDPHIHLFLGAMLYAQPMAPPWQTSTLDGMIDGYDNRQQFLQRLSKLWQRHRANPQTASKPLIVYGYHHLVHGKLDRYDLDAIAANGSLLIWHYSAHDFYFNSHAIKAFDVKPELAQQYHGVELFDAGQHRGQLTGRIYEDAYGWLLPKLAPYILNPAVISKGFTGFMKLLAQYGVTTAAEMAYGLFGRALEDQYMQQLYDPSKVATKIYLVPEQRAFHNEFKQQAVAAILSRVEQTKNSALPVLPQVKFFADAAFYSQTMRFVDSDNQTNGLWVIQPDDMVDTLKPYWDAGLDLHIHSNGDLAQSSTLNAIQKLTEQSTTATNPRAIIEHAGLLLPEHIRQASQLNVGISAASFYVYYLGEKYRAKIADKVDYITPLGSAMDAGIVSSLHSDAPLAPPSPLLAAARHVLRDTSAGTVVGKRQRLTKLQALAAITINAAWSLGLEQSIGSIEQGKRADFTILDENPLQIDASNWHDIGIWGVMKSGALFSKCFDNRHSRCAPCGEKTTDNANCQGQD